MTTVGRGTTTIIAGKTAGSPIIAAAKAAAIGMVADGETTAEAAVGVAVATADAAIAAEIAAGIAHTGRDEPTAATGVGEMIVETAGHGMRTDAAGTTGIGTTGIGLEATALSHATAVVILDEGKSAPRHTATGPGKPNPPPPVRSPVLLPQRTARRVKKFLKRSSTASPRCRWSTASTTCTRKIRCFSRSA